MEGNRVIIHTCFVQYPLCYVGSSMCLHSKVHRSMLLVSLRYVQYSMCRVTNFKVHYAMLLLLCGKVRFAMLARLWCYILKCNVASFITLCSILYVASDKFQSALCYMCMLLLLMWQSALCYAGPSSVLHSKMQSSMPLVVVYYAMFSRPNVLF